jgi:(1->4)-alpha-D-glucan 1-alpha-D-glucosylmutase
LGFTRAERVATVVTRRASELEQNGGWRENHVVLPEGSWRDLLTAREVPGGAVGLTELLDRLPVALLVRG